MTSNPVWRLVNKSIVCAAINLSKLHKTNSEAACICRTSLQCEHYKKAALQSDFLNCHPTSVGWRGQYAAYLSRASTLCCDWLAWASMAVAACAMICVRASSVEALAKSVSCTRLRDAEVLVDTLVKLSAA